MDKLGVCVGGGGWYQVGLARNHLLKKNTKPISTDEADD